MLFLLTFFQLVSCNPKKGNPEKLSSAKEIVFDTSEKIIIDTTEVISRDSSMSLFIKLLGLESIRNKINNEEIRIWYNNLSDTGKIVILKNDGEWHSAEYAYKAIFGKRSSVIGLDKTVKINEPVSGWPVFRKDLIDLGIYKLKSYKQIPNYYVCNDGDAIVVEIWKNNSYTLYDYPCFSIYKDSLNDVIKIKNIYLLLQKELGYRLVP